MYADIFKFFVPFAMLVTVLCSLNGIYDQYYGFFLSNAFFHLACVFFVSILIASKVRKFFTIWYLLFLSYVISTSLLFYTSSLFGNIAFLNLTLLFIVALPMLNRYLSINIKVHKLILMIVFAFTLLYLLANIETYASGGFFLNKEKYNSLISGINSMGYLLYLGFTISWMLGSVTGRQRYKVLTFLYLAFCLVLIPVLTVYFGIFAYVITIFYLNRSRISKKLILCSLIVISVIIAFILINTFDNWKVYLSLRDLIYVSSIELIAEKFWTGYGINNWGYLSLEMQNPHNFILYVLLSFGFLGLTLYIVYLCYVFIRSVSNIKAFPESLYYKHMHAQLISHILIMSSFVAMPGNYQAISLMLSIFYAMVINGITYVRVPSQKTIKTRV